MGQNFPAKIWREAKKEYRYLGQEGKLLYWTTVKVAGEGYEKLVPYMVGLIRIGSNEIISGQLVDWEGKKLKKGIKVIGVPRRMRIENREGLIRYGIKWKIK